MYLLKQVRRYLLAATAMAVFGVSYSFAYQDNDVASDTVVQSSNSSENIAPLGLVAPSTPAIDSIDGTGMRRIAIDPETRSIDGTGMHRMATDPETRSIDGTGLRAIGQDGTESIDGTGRALSSPADNLADSGQTLRTLEGSSLRRSTPAGENCTDDAAMSADCDTDVVDGE